MAMIFAILGIGGALAIGVGVLSYLDKRENERFSTLGRSDS